MNPDRETRTILVIDDSETDRQIYARLLARSPLGPYAVIEAECAEEGLERFADGAIDCVLLDYNLPDADGLDVLDELQRVSTHEAPVVMLTGGGSEAIAVEAMKRGGSDYILKNDANGERLPQAIENAIEKVTLRREVERRRADLEASQREQIELKNRFLSHVSHELRTPLTAVHQFLSLCLDGVAGELNDTQREYLAIAQRNTTQLKNMIGDLMELTRAQSGKLRVEIAPMELGELVEDLVRTLGSGASEKQIELVAEVAGPLPTALADPTRVRQILGNLIENALKFTAKGGRVTVRAELEADGEQVRLSVRDTGCGISEAGQQAIFQRLHQEENLDSAESRQGLGLGLSICKELVHLQGGRIWVESEEGVGSTFQFTLPVYSLARVVSPALEREGSLRDEYVVLRVSVRAPEGEPSEAIGDDVSRRVHQLIGKVVYYPYDVVLPRLWQTGTEDVHFAVVATDAAGLKAVVPRVRSVLESQLATKLPNARLRVDARVETVSAQNGEEPRPSAIDEVVERIEVLMRDPREWEQ